MATALVLVFAVFGWFELRDKISNEGTAAAGTCVEGSSVLHVAADPSIAPAVTELARRYGDTDPVVRDHCLTLDVRSIASSDVGTALAKGTWDSGFGAQPALWIPQSSTAIADLGRADVVDGTPKSVAESPVTLAVPAALAGPLTTAGIGWKDLARLQSNPASLTSIGLADWGSLRLDLPIGDASSLALNAVSAAAQNLGSTSPDLAQAGSPSTRGATSLLATVLTSTGPGGSTAAAADPRSTSDVVTALDEQTAADAAPIHAVPVTEQELFSAKSTRLSAFFPTGPTPIVDYPAAILSGSWVDDTQSLAAAQFVDYIRQPDQSKTLVAAGFRAGGAVPSATPGSAFPAISETMTPMVGGVSALLRDELIHPQVARRVTVLLDVSKSMTAVDGSATRLQNSVAAVTSAFDVALDTSAAGLWVYSRDLTGTNPFRVLAPTAQLTDAQRMLLGSAGAALQPSGDTYTYVSVRAAYTDAVTNFAAGTPNSVLLITGGGDNDPGVPGRQLLDVITAAMDPARPVSIDVIDIGTTADMATLQSVSTQTGGTFTAMTSSNSPEFAAAVAAAFGQK